MWQYSPKYWNLKVLPMAWWIDEVETAMNTIIDDMASV